MIARGIFTGIRRCWARGVVGFSLVVFALAAPLAAQEAKKDVPNNPVGAGAAWNAKVESPAGVELDAKQMALVGKVSSYFNTLNNLKGSFVQTAPDNKRMRGRFFVKKPGRLRFEYAAPSKQLIVSDGQMVAIQDFDINTDDRIALDQTPFRLLVKKDVDLLRDARISDVQEADDLAVITLQDKSTDVAGRIKLFLSKGPELELKEWVTTDAQGLDTRVEVSGLVKSEEIDVALFKITSPQILNLQKNQ